uniref:Arrestin C-terminal-like domain-containing protein n=1 Tax=Glossina brevipalpis TaxID=37001 RepID=A0A1A9W1Y5_9MUSC
MNTLTYIGFFFCFRRKKLFQFLDILPVYHFKHSSAINNQRNNGGNNGGDDSSNINISPASSNVSEQTVFGTMKSNIMTAEHHYKTSQPHQEQQEQQQGQHLQPLPTQLQQRRLSPGAQFYRSSCFSFPTETLLLNMTTGELINTNERSPGADASTASTAATTGPISGVFTGKDDFGTQRVYKKTSPNCVLTLYLPNREITLSGNSPAIIRGIVYVDPKAIQGYRVYAQLTLTFRYGREDEEVMGLRFCNEAIMSLHQIWPRHEEPHRETLTPLQDALMKRLGEGAHPFTLSLTSQAPPSVQLVPAKCYYGAPIGTSYDVRCFIADKTDDKFHRRASVKMGVRVIYRTDVYGINGPENFATIINNPLASPSSNTTTTAVASVTDGTTTVSGATALTDVLGNDDKALHAITTTTNTTVTTISTTTEGNALNFNDRTTRSSGKGRKSERGDSFPKLRLSPKSFRFSGRFGRNGRVGLKASLDKAWYTHGEEICVTINIRNDSRKTVRKIRVCAIQHVDVCMFNNGKFKNVVAETDIPSSSDRIVTPGTTFNTVVILKPERGTTKNWIALEDSLQRSTEPDEIIGNIAASAVRTPHYLMQASHSPNYCSSPGVCIPPVVSAIQGGSNAANGATHNERNVFAIYVSYYIKIKLTLSGMGGELSLKLPFVLVHIDEEQKHLREMQIKKINLDKVPSPRKISEKSEIDNDTNDEEESTQQPIIVDTKRVYSVISDNLDQIESIDGSEHLHIKVPPLRNAGYKRRLLMRSETIAKDFEDELNDTDDAELEAEENNGKLDQVVHLAQVHYDINTIEEHADKEDKTSKSDEATTTENLEKLSIKTTNSTNGA